MGHDRTCWRVATAVAPRPIVSQLLIICQRPLSRIGPIAKPFHVFVRLLRLFCGIRTRAGELRRSGLRLVKLGAGANGGDSEIE